MEPPLDLPCAQSFALRLSAGRSDAALAGELEHVISGECRRFASAEELLAVLHDLLGRHGGGGPDARR